ncbi:MAG: cysteine desulfurase [Candidatus Nomurabacteria bacterium]|jgi:cysteine desulfurase|nr:cysteine desulfurase [Candidatus Nomurabacteria bacterium]
MIYLDHAAATPISKRALRAMEPYFAEKFFNPSSPYFPAVEVRREYEAAKNTIGGCIGVKGSTLVMTAGATESVNLAFQGFASCLVSEIEHSAVLETARSLPMCEFVRVQANGMIDVEDLATKITEETELVSVGLVNNETGMIQPLKEIAEVVQAERMRRSKCQSSTPLFLHSDASQGLTLLKINAAKLGVDLLTLNAGKVYGPKQVGALYVRHGAILKPVVRGGGQEAGLRSGTENVAGVVGFATALSETAARVDGERKRLTKLKQLLIRELSKNFRVAPLKSHPEIGLIGDEKKQLASFVPLTVLGLDAERLVFMLEERGVLVSTGAACAASKGARSHVLTAMGLSAEAIAGSLRMTLGKLSDEQNVVAAARILTEVIQLERQRLERKK